MSDLILVNGNVIPLDAPPQQIETIVIGGGKIVAVGDRRTLREFRKRATEVIDCNGKTVLPGFVEAHCHLYGLADTLATIRLEPWLGIRSIADIQAKIREASQGGPQGEWIRARGYHEFDLVERRHPTRWDLDAATSAHPVKLTHRTGQAHVLNSLALQQVGISGETEDPPEGLIDRDLATGEPTGLLYGMEDHLAKTIPPMDRDQLEHGVELGSRQLTAAGITSVQDVSWRNDLDRWEMVQGWKERGLLKPRVRMASGFRAFLRNDPHVFKGRIEETQFYLGGIKLILHETTGRLHPRQEELNEQVLEIHRAGQQAILHAIEENVIEAACSAVEYALKWFPRSDHRHRIEHCAVCSPRLAKRIASLGMVVVTQPSFIYHHGGRYLRTVSSEKLPYLYPVATLQNQDVRVAGSFDSPVVPANPLTGIFSAVSRMTESGETVLPKEGIPVLGAIRMFTLSAAEAMFEEKIKGSIAPGKVGDLVVLNGDPTQVPIHEVKDLKVEMTILNGEVVYDGRG